MMIKSRIGIGKCIHQGKELDCYLPEVCVNETWMSALSPGDYILKDSYNPLITCVKCGGHDGKCKKCNGIGLNRGASVDNIDIAEWYIKKAIEEVELLEKLKLKYEPIYHG